ncbi:MAG: hypothetical protein ABI182_06680 [Candidatus Baltobacteraceae bacterium]
MSRKSPMTPLKRRRLSIGVLAFFIVMCGMIGWGQWYAYHHNVPTYERRAK